VHLHTAAYIILSLGNAQGFTYFSVAMTFSIATKQSLFATLSI